MEQKRTCPECGSPEYTFRSRKKLPAQAGNPEMTETKYRCKTCEHEWKVRVAVGQGTPDSVH
jgi:DNA-directed RNA polymerase subunit M/transcription elongation factor TFIIS